MIFIFPLFLRIAVQTGYDKLKLTNYYQQQDFEGAVQYLKSFAGLDAETISFNKDLVKATYYYRLFQKNKKGPGNTGEKRVIDFGDDFLKESRKKKNN